VARALTKAASLAQDLVQRFEERIRSGEMPAGSRFPTEKSITDDFKVSRTVVREAFARLAAQGLLESRRGAGAFVPTSAPYRAFELMPSELQEIEDVVRLLEMRVGFESEMAGLAAERRTEEDLALIKSALEAMGSSSAVDSAVDADAAFHAAIARATHNAYFERFCEFLGTRLVPSRRLYLQNSDQQFQSRYAKIIERDHNAIYRAIAAKDEIGARRAARRHIMNSIQRHRSIRDATDA
jgi:GntR family transcriptional regulator, transcriptional repressor for pyruvate dehydrogenase complex